jgi:hypothetical protein
VADEYHHAFLTNYVLLLQSKDFRYIAPGIDFYANNGTVNLNPHLDLIEYRYDGFSFHLGSGWSISRKDLYTTFGVHVKF